LTEGFSSIVVYLFIGPVMTVVFVVKPAMCGGSAIVGHLTPRSLGSRPWLPH